jgi:hypothetical protein
MTADTQKILGTMSLAFSIAFFALGMYFPLLSTHTQLVFKFGYKEITVLKSIQIFFKGNEYFLAIVPHPTLSITRYLLPDLLIIWILVLLDLLCFLRINIGKYTLGHPD